MKKKIKRLIDLYLSQYKWARKLHGGKWVIRKGMTPTLNCPGEWVAWNDPEDILFGGWPLNEDEFICEEYP